jgi:hypothetical protein
MWYFPKFFPDTSSLSALSHALRQVLPLFSFHMWKLRPQVLSDFPWITASQCKGFNSRCGWFQDSCTSYYLCLNCHCQIRILSVGAFKWLDSCSLGRSDRIRFKTLSPLCFLLPCLFAFVMDNWVSILLNSRPSLSPGRSCINLWCTKVMDFLILKGIHILSLGSYTDKNTVTAGHVVHVCTLSTQEAEDHEF